MRFNSKYLIFAVFLTTLVITSFLIWFYIDTNNKQSSASKIPTLSVNLPAIGEVVLYVNREEADRMNVDKSSLQNISYSYPESSLTGDSQVFYGKFVRYENNLLTINPRANNYNLSFLVLKDSDIICWPKFITSSNGTQINLADIWIDTRNGNGLHINDEVFKKWGDVSSNIKEGDSVFINLKGRYDLKLDNKPDEIVVVGCK